MKTVLLGLLVVFLFSGISFADQWVNGYYKDTNGDGVKDTYVQGHHRTSADSKPNNNYSTKGNVNPYTGEKGYVNPYGSQQNNNTYPYGTNKRYGY